MSMYWEAYSGTALVLSPCEYESMLDAYKQKNPEEASIIESAFEDEEMDCTPIIKSVYAGHHLKRNDDEEVNECDSDKVICTNVITDDFTSGINLTPHYVNGEMNINKENPDGTYNRIKQTEYENAYVFFADKDITGPQAFISKPYASYDELVSEFKDKLQAYLPEDFDWDAHIGWLQYAAYA